MTEHFLCAERWGIDQRVVRAPTLNYEFKMRDGNSDRRCRGLHVRADNAIMSSMDSPTSSLIDPHRSDVEAACRRFHVARLDLFGSATTGELRNDSDLDFLVTFDEVGRDRAFDNFFGLKARLEEIFGRDVDLVSARTLRNPYFKREVEKQRQLVYAASP